MKYLNWVLVAMMAALLVRSEVKAQGGLADEINTESQSLQKKSAEDLLLEDNQDAPAQPAPIVEAPAPSSAPVAAPKKSQAKASIPPAEAPATASPAESLSTTPASGLVQVKSLDFLANENGGTIVIKTSGPVMYNTRTNPSNKQFIVEVSGVSLPKKFQRPYDTKEFKGAIGMFQAYQNKGSDSANFVIQLKQDTEPVVQQEGNSLLIVASGIAGATSAPSAQAANAKTGSTDSADLSKAGGGASTIVADGSTQPTTTSDDKSKILGAKTLEDFLTGSTKFYGSRINIQITDGDVRDIFGFIADQSGLNLVLADDVKGKISLKLKNIPWDQALILIMQAKQLGYVRQGNILRIAPLTALKTESEAAKQVVDSARLLQPLRVRIFNVSYAKASDMVNQTKDFLSANGRGKVVADDRTNSLIVTDIDENISKIAKLIKTLDTQTPQVLIEARVVEARETLKDEIGVQWTASGSASYLGQSNQGGIGITPKLNVGVSSATTPGNHGLGITFGRLDILGDISAALNLLETEEKVRVISAPRIVTLNNVKATIEQTTDVPITVQTVVNGVTTQSTTYKPVKLNLSVTPQITAEGGVIMQLKVLREFTGTPAKASEAPPINSRSADTTVLVPNGDTAVIGGIYQSDVSTGEERNAFLSKIPIIGWLFKYKTESKQKNELMIFLTPRVLNRDRAFVGESSVTQ